MLLVPWKGYGMGQGFLYQWEALQDRGSWPWPVWTCLGCLPGLLGLETCWKKVQTDSRIQRKLVSLRFDHIYILWQRRQLQRKRRTMGPEKNKKRQCETQVQWNHSGTVDCSQKHLLMLNPKRYIVRKSWRQDHGNTISHRMWTAQKERKYQYTPSIWTMRQVWYIPSSSTLPLPQVGQLIALTFSGSARANPLMDWWIDWLCM